MILLGDPMKGNTPIWTAHRFLRRNKTSPDGSEEKVYQGPDSTLAGAAAGRGPQAPPLASVRSWRHASDKAGSQP